MCRMTSNQLSPQATFSELLRRWRRSHFLEQADFAKLLSPVVHQSTVSGWESGIRRPSLKYLRQIVALTGIPAHLALDIPEDDRP
jgi:DNA-binding transcriptional regulator YiaG